jgi:imidazolonepropionase
MTVKIWENARIATMAADAATPYGLIEDGVVAVRDGRIAWVGARKDVPCDLRRGAEEHDAQGGLLTPGLIDCHTHLVYGGNRASEFEARLNGATYEEIARAGGGIIATVKATRAATEGELLAQSARRLRALVAEGVTTLEIKSGYGLTADDEAKCLRVARRLGQMEAVSVRTTFLGAHAVPPEFAGRADDYVLAVCRMLPQLHAQGLVDAVDAFCETIAFSPAQVQQVFEVARALKLPVKLHAEQLSDSAGAELAASYGAISCDHLEWLSESGARAMARAGSVAVLLPGAFYFLRETRVPPVALLRENRVPIAISTDCNPGTSPCTSLLLMLNMACTLFGMTPQEALAGVTRNAALALGLRDRGALAPGLRADFVQWDVTTPAELCYALGSNPRRFTIFEGQVP